MSSTPSFIVTSPSEQLVIPSPANDSTAEIQPSPPMRAPAISDLADKDLSTNAPASPPSKSRSVTPRPADFMRQPPLPSQIQSYEKEKEQPLVGSFAWFQRGNSSPPTLPESEAHELNRVLRGRALRVNTLHQRVYHSQDLSPLTYPPDDYASRSDLLATTEFDIDKDFLLQQSPPLLPSPSKPRFLPNSHVSRSPIAYLLRKVISLPDSPQAWLGLYFVLNLTLTLYNKSVLMHFPFPYTLTAIHALCGTIGTFVLLRLESTENGTRSGSRLVAPNLMPNLSGKELIVLFLFSILYTVNIIVSNASLRLVTVPVRISSISIYS
jgi:hypothetical protein